MLTHLVLFRLKRPIADGAQERLVAALEAFAADAPHAEGPARVAADARARPAEHPRASDALIEVRFADADAFRAYLDHPRHRALVADVLEPECERWLTLQA